MYISNLNENYIVIPNRYKENFIIDIQAIVLHVPLKSFHILKKSIIANGIVIAMDLY